MRRIPSDIGKWAWMPLRHTGTPRTIRPSRKPPMPDASRYRHAADHTPVAQTAHAGREQVPALPHTELRRHS